MWNTETIWQSAAYGNLQWSSKRVGPAWRHDTWPPSSSGDVYGYWWKCEETAWYIKYSCTQFSLHPVSPPPLPPYPLPPSHPRNRIWFLYLSNSFMQIYWLRQNWWSFCYLFWPFSVMHIRLSESTRTGRNISRIWLNKLIGLKQI